MISVYDGHAYCFPSLHGSGGFEQKEVFEKHQQVAISQHFQPVWTDHDRALVPDVSKISPADKWNIDSVKDIDFGPTHRGRYEWSYQGVRYVKQYMPPSVTNMSYDADDLVAEMDYAGVDRALLHRTPYLGLGNKYIYDCVQRFPDRLQGLAHVPEWQITDKIDDSIKMLEFAISELGLKGLQFLPDHMTLYNKAEDWDSNKFDPFWRSLEKLNVPLFITPRYTSLAGKSDLVENLNYQLQKVGNWMKKYPSIKVIWTHGLAWRLFIEKDGLSIPSSVYKAAPLGNPNFYLQLLFPIFLGGVWDFPMKPVLPTLKELNERVGADRLIWGTDMPMVMRYYTYKQCLDQIKEYGKEVLSEKEIEMICGGNMYEIMDSIN
tara:strand:+ start:1398 stop:2528 length:1131 start_codon:yes stop_codon:yes gene_type:complete